MTDEAMQPYQRIAQDVRDQIRRGQLKGGDKLPSTRELAERYEVAPGTVARALADLRSSGVIYAHQGRGTFISETALQAVADPTAQAIQSLRDEVAELRERLECLERTQNAQSSS